MGSLELFPKHQIVGIFRGFQQGGLEFHADLVLPYRNDFHNIPMHGQFLLVQLETPDEAVLGRIASFSSEGKLSFGSGEEFNIRAVKEERAIPEDLREQYLKYRINIRVLGVIRKNGRGLTFVPSHRRLPHVGSKVAFPSSEALAEIAGHNIDGAPIGHLAFGEYVYAKGSNDFDSKEWMQVLAPEILIKFPIESLVSRRSFIFARAGFGKSNLNKLLFSKLYEATPYVKKRGGKDVPVGTIIFDPNGEYFWPDDKGRPALCDVPDLEDKLVVFTKRKNPSQFYQSFVAGGIKLDIRSLKPSDVIAIALSPDKQEQQNVKKLKGLSQDKWRELVDVIDIHGHATESEIIRKALNLDEKAGEAETIAARSNMTSIVKMLHDKSSQLMDKLIYTLSQGKICIIDVSQMRGGQSLVLSGIILRRIFERNQEEFTSADPKTIPTIAVVEEAQSVLNDKSQAAEPYIEWVKEGRKYDLGALLITQQPGSIPTELLSQGDNWFIFHLLSATDLTNVKKANAHFSEDLLSSLLNEPIPGQGVFWSSVEGKPYPLSLKVLSFEKQYNLLDPAYSRSASVKSFAHKLRENFDDKLKETALKITERNEPMLFDKNCLSDEGLDAMQVNDKSAIDFFKQDPIIEKIKVEGAYWAAVVSVLQRGLPQHLDNANQIAYNLVRKALDEVFGKDLWKTEQREKKDQSGKKTTFILLK